MAAPWTDEEVELLRDCLTKGMSYGQMLPLFPGKARNALIGKAHRKGFHRMIIDPQRAVPVPKYRKMSLMGIPLGAPAPAGTELSHGIVGSPVATPPEPQEVSFRGFKFQMMPDEPAPAPLPPPPDWSAPKAAPAPAEPEPIQPPSGGVLLMDLREQHCRWPINDGNPFRFCGCQKQTGKSYCAVHVKAAAPKASEKRKPYVPAKVSAYKFRTTG